MRITKIAVKGLFGMFDHEIPLNQESRITILNGPNGVGKTVLLNMIDALFDFEFQYLKKIPFNEFYVELQEGAVADLKSCLKVTKSDDDSTFCIQYEDMSETEYPVFRPLDVETEQLDRAIREALPRHSKLRLQGKTYWVDDQFYKGWVTSDRPHLFSDFLSMTALFAANVELYFKVFGEHADWFRRVCEEIVVDSIGTQRLLQKASVVDVADWSDDKMPTGRVLESLYVIGTHFYSTFGEELQGDVGGTSLDAEAILFFDIFRDKLLFKSMKLLNLQGTDYAKFACLANDGTEIPYSGLSSGEQNLLYLYFRLIFWHDEFGLSGEIPKLIMIDEPELSMNVVWQRNFLKDLQRIIELRKFDVLIATHSPEVIYDKWDWVVHLGEKVDD